MDKVDVFFEHLEQLCHAVQDATNNNDTKSVTRFKRSMAVARRHARALFHMSCSPYDEYAQAKIKELFGDDDK